MPVLATPVARRKFDETGRLTPTHGAYPDALRAVARELKVPLLDLERETSAWLQSEGDAASKRYFMWIAPGQYPRLADGRQDDTHFVEAGARHVAELAISDMRALKLPIVARLADVARLTAALTSTDPRAREASAHAAGRLGQLAVTAIDPLVAALADDDLYVRGAAASALGRLGRPAVAALTRALADSRADVRWSAGIALGRMGPDAAPAVAMLTHAAADAHDQVRYAAVVALGEIGEAARPALPVLTAALSDRTDAVRAAARRVLRRVAPDTTARPFETASVSATIERLTPALMAELHVPGVSVALVHDGRIAWSGAYGVANAMTRVPVTPETAFEAASMSKPVFALLAMQLAEQQRLDLDRALTSYVDDPAVPRDVGRHRITARMALNHTSGLPNWRPGGEEREGPLPLLFTPGTRYGYSGEAFGLLQRAVEQLAGARLDALAQTRLFGPLGLRHIGYAWTPAIGQTQATGHKDDGSVLTTSKYEHPHAAYTLYTTAEDYARVLIEVMKAERGASALVSQGSVRDMLVRHVAIDGIDPIERPGNTGDERAFRGLGWAINTTAHGDVAHHSGANGTGFRSFAQFNPSRGTALVILTNGVRGGELWTRVVAAVGDF